MTQKLYNGVRVVNRPCLENVRRLDMGVIPMVMEMERTGMRIDTDHLARFSAKLAVEMVELNERANQMTGYQTELSSADQVAELLFRKLGIPNQGVKLTDSGKREQVDADQLEVLRHKHEVIPVILEYRQHQKLKTTYCDPLPRLIRTDTHRLHTQISTTRTATGRLASSKPNLQNIPTRTKLGREIRKAFVPESGNVIGGVDLSQIELRLLASERQVLRMMEVFHANGDLHTETAIDIFQHDRKAIYPQLETYNKHEHSPIQTSDGVKGCVCPTCTLITAFRKDERAPCKNINFGIVYDITAPGLATLIAVSGGNQNYWTEKVCESTIFKWHTLYPEVQEGIQRIARLAKMTGLVWDMFGRIRWVPEVKSVHKWIYSQGMRQAGNMPIQSGAAGILKLAMAEIWDEWVRYWSKFGVRLLMQIHDEILVEGPASVVEDFLYYCGVVMENCIELSVPLSYGVAISEKSWGDLNK